MTRTSQWETMKQGPGAVLGVFPGGPVNTAAVSADRADEGQVFLCRSVYRLAPIRRQAVALVSWVMTRSSQHGGVDQRSVKPLSIHRLVQKLV